MRTYIFSALLLSLPSAALAADREYDFSNFNAVHVHDGVSATIDTSDAFRVTADAKRGNLDRLILEQKGDVLTIRRANSWGFWRKGKHDRFEVEITLPQLIEIRSTAGSAVHVLDAGNALVSAKSSSGASLRIDDAQLGNVTLSSNSGASLHIEGTCQEVTAQSSSGASLNADDLVCHNANLDASSGASLHANATDLVSVDGSSGASLRLDGGAAVSAMKVSSGASFRAN